MFGQTHMDVPIVFKDVSFHRATNIPKEGSYNTTVHHFVSPCGWYDLSLVSLFLPACVHDSKTQTLNTKERPESDLKFMRGQATNLFYITLLCSLATWMKWYGCLFVRLANSCVIFFCCFYGGRLIDILVVITFRWLKSHTTQCWYILICIITKN
jgi:hypothetical protein